MALPSYEEMLRKLDEVYDKEEELEKQLALIVSQIEQNNEDKEMLQNFLMYSYNKSARSDEQRRLLKK